MSSDEDSNQSPRSNIKSPQKRNNFSILSNKKSKQLLSSLDRSMSYNDKQNIKQTSPSNNNNNSIKIPNNNNFSSNIIRDQSSLQQQNKKLRKKLKQLSQRLDQQLQRAAQNKLKMQSLSKHNHPPKPQLIDLQLSNAHKIIQRLQKSVKDFQNKQSYQISVKRIMDLQSLLKKKQTQILQLNDQIKTNKKQLREKDKVINQMIENTKKNTNITEDKEIIQKLKKKLKKVTEENQQLRKKQLTKHQQLVKAERKIVQMEQQEELPIGREESLIKELEQCKKKYKQAMTRIQKQNVYITRLNQKLDQEKYNLNKGRKSQSDKDKRNVSKSLEELPQLSNFNKIKTGISLMDHLPSPKQQVKLKRY